MNEVIECWHFARTDRKLGYKDGRLIEVGAIHKVDATPKCCAAGLHGSIRAIDALAYAAGPIISRVRIWGMLDKQSDKLCGKVREYLAVSDATEELRSFARWCALHVIHLWNVPEIVRQYLETGDESIRATARDAAWTAAMDVAGDAAMAAANTAAWAAAGDAAMDVAGDAARAAANTAAWAAAGDAARDTAWAAVRAAAVDAQNAELDRRLRRLFANCSTWRSS
jgi:hypothetical protein